MERLSLLGSGLRTAGLLGEPGGAGRLGLEPVLGEESKEKIGLLTSRYGLEYAANCVPGAPMSNPACPLGYHQAMLTLPLTFHQKICPDQSHAP